jgi:hypothetical protein
MARKIRFVTDTVKMTATLDDSAAASAVIAKLPIEGMAETLGASVSVFADVAAAGGQEAEEVETGTVAYWPAMSSLAVFYGSQPPTPVIPIGKIDGDPKAWLKVMGGSTVRVEKA